MFTVDFLHLNVKQYILDNTVMTNWELLEITEGEWNRQLTFYRNIIPEDLKNLGVNEALLKYKNEVPLYIHYLEGNKLFKCRLEHINILGWSKSDINAVYVDDEIYDVSDTGTYKKIVLLGVPEDGLTDSKIEQMIEQGAELFEV